MVRMDEADAEIDNTITELYGQIPAMEIRIEPGKNHFDQIARLRADRNELDDMADDYDERHDEITAEIRRLVKYDHEHPEPDKPVWTLTGRTVAQEWDAKSKAGRRDWLKQNGWTVTAIRDSEMPGGWRLTINAGFTAESMRQAESLGFPVRELSKRWPTFRRPSAFRQRDLPHKKPIPPDGTRLASGGIALLRDG